MTDERTPFAQEEDLESRYPGSSTDGSSAAPVYHGTFEGKQQKTPLFIFLAVIILSCLIALVLCIVEGVSQGSQGFLYFMHAACLSGFIAVELLLLRFIKTGDLAKEKAWFLYFLGICIIVQSVILDIVVIH